MKRWIAVGILSALCLALFFFLSSSYVASESARAELNSTRAELASTQAELEATLDNLNSTAAELADCQLGCDGSSNGHGYTITDPTYKQMMNFIRGDKTDKHPYIEGEYVCENFAMDVCNNAEEKGIRCAYVIIHYPDSGHAIVAFNTIDRGLIYIESQSDELVEPVIGEHYYQCVIPKPGYYYEEPGYDDTIEEIHVIW
jgi:hypothetical protein